MYFYVSIFSSFHNNERIERRERNKQDQVAINSTIKNYIKNSKNAFSLNLTLTPFWAVFMINVNILNTSCILEYHSCLVGVADFQSTN